MSRIDHCLLCHSYHSPGVCVEVFLVARQTRDNESINCEMWFFDDVEVDILLQNCGAIVLVTNNYEFLNPILFGLVCSVTMIVEDVKEVESRSWVVIW